MPRPARLRPLTALTLIPLAALAYAAAPAPAQLRLPEAPAGLRSTDVPPTDLRPSDIGSTGRSPQEQHRGTGEESGTREVVVTGGPQDPGEPTTGTRRSE